MTYNASRALELLRIGSGHAGATFREGQEEAIRHIIEGHGRSLVVQKTGWGKSFVYFIATKMLREAGAGPAILVSPLLALMRNQVAAAERMGVRAATINSTNTEDWDDIEMKLSNGEIDILLISPERLANAHFRAEVLAAVASQISLLVVDEAHCISDWGHDFRPHYRLLERMIGNLPPNLRVLATTATANDRVMSDLQTVLDLDHAQRGDLNRPALTLQAIKLSTQAERMAWIAEQLETLEGHGIIYALTRRDANQLARWLQSRGCNVEAYTGETGERREGLEQALLDNEVKALIATSALGMGFDKPDLAFVIHYQMPGSVIAYYQQVGRAGRALDAARGILLSGQEDEQILDWFIKTAFPSRHDVDSVLKALRETPDGLSAPEIESKVNLGRGQIKKVIDLLSLESPAPIGKEGAKWQLTAAELGDGFWQRAERLTGQRESEKEQMLAYVDLPFGQHMRFLVGALDGDPAAVQVPKLQPLPTKACDELVNAATEFLRRTSLPFDARKYWPKGRLPIYDLSGKIEEEHRAEQGRALCVWGDAGWGKLVRCGKYHDGWFSDQLVSACAQMFQEWNPQPSPEWVTCVPSLRHPNLVPDFAARVAQSLGLPFHPVLMKTDDRPEQKTMANSAHQAGNIDGSMKLDDVAMRHGPVLLIDDMVDSRWTFTTAAWLLRAKGCGEVWPMALSMMGYED